MMLLGSTAQAESLETVLKSIEARADTCIAQNDCTSFAMKNPFLSEVMSNQKFVQDLIHRCTMGTECYSLSMRVSQKYMETINYIK